MTAYCQSALILLASLWYLSHQAGRLDRLHHRVDATRSALDANLRHRATVLADAAARMTGAPAAQAATCAHDSLMADPSTDVVHRAALENAVTHAVVALLHDQESAEAIDRLGVRSDLLHACRRVSLSRRFHADAVQACLRIRRQDLVRLAHLAGHAALPRTIDFADDVTVT